SAVVGDMDLFESHRAAGRENRSTGLARYAAVAQREVAQREEPARTDLEQPERIRPGAAERPVALDRPTLSADGDRRPHHGGSSAPFDGRRQRDRSPLGQGEDRAAATRRAVALWQPGVGRRNRVDQGATVPGGTLG